MRRSILRVLVNKRPRCELFRGDCLDVLRTLPTASVDAVITDPPYGIAYRNKRAPKPLIVNDERPFIWWMWEASRILKPTGALVCFCRWDVQEPFRTSIELAGMTVRSQWIWDKKAHGMGDCARTLSPRHETIWFATKPGFRFSNGRPASVLEQTNIPGVLRKHPTEKPVELMKRIVRAVTPLGGVVLDPCMGSGATGAGCGNDFGFVGIEIDRGHFATALRRLRSPKKKKKE